MINRINNILASTKKDKLVPGSDKNFDKNNQEFNKKQNDCIDDDQSQCEKLTEDNNNSKFKEHL